MLYIQIITIIALLLTVFFSYDEYKKGTMKLRNFKIICVCEGVALLGMIYLILAYEFIEEQWVGYIGGE